ncbi:MAG: glucose 1-dehydrogenase [Sphingomonadales bacterium]
MTQRLTGKGAIVTGGSGGIGAAIAKRLAGDGAKVIVHYGSNAAAAEDVVTDIQAAGGQAVAMQGDVRQVDSLQAFFKAARAELDSYNILVNNAGVATGAPIGDVVEKQFDKVFAINVKAVLFAMQDALLNMAENGRVVNIASSVTEFNNPGLSVYSASKHAVRGLTNVAAKELGERGITVNDLMPGPVEPGMFETASESHRDFAISSTPFKRLGTPEDVADACAFLASDDSRWITGQHILCNGGALI